MTSRTSSSGGRSASMSRILVRWTITSRDRDFRQLQKAAEHVALGALDVALAMQNVDRAHQLLMAGNARIRLDSETPHSRRMPRTSASTALTIGPKTRDEEQHERRDQQRNAVGIGDRDGLRHHLAENDDQRGHDDGRGPHAVIAVKFKQNAGRDRRRADGDELTAEQHRADEAPAHRRSAA